MQQPSDGPGIGWWVKRAFVAFMFALCSAFAAAACGDRPLTWNWARKAIRANPREARPYIALAVTYGLIKPATVIRALHRHGRGL